MVMSPPATNASTNAHSSAGRNVMSAGSGKRDRSSSSMTSKFMAGPTFPSLALVRATQAWQDRVNGTSFDSTHNGSAESRKDWAEAKSSAWMQILARIIMNEAARAGYPVLFINAASSSD